MRIPSLYVAEPIDMEILTKGKQQYAYYEYNLEEEFEKEIVNNAAAIFGSQTIYIDTKRRIGDSIVSIPDGYLIDLTIPSDPKLYIIENELSSHDPYRHIGAQILKFAISYKESGRKIKKLLLDYVTKSPEHLKVLENAVGQSSYRNIDDLVEAIIFDKKIKAVVVIDESSDQLDNVLSQLTIDTDIIEFQTFANGTEKIHKFSPFNVDIREYTEDRREKSTSVDELDTVVIAARDRGFTNVFLEQDCWHAIRISAAMIERLKYIAAYQTAPVSAITHYAEIASIKKYEDTNKYIVFFKEKAKAIKPIKLDMENFSGAPMQGPRYASFEKMIGSKSLSEVFL